jgi:hypothetical protein
MQKTIDLKNSSEGARIRLWDVFRDLYTLDRGERDLAFENTAIGAADTPACSQLVGSV